MKVDRQSLNIITANKGTEFRWKFDINICYAMTLGFKFHEIGWKKKICLERWTFKSGGKTQSIRTSVEATLNSKDAIHNLNNDYPFRKVPQTELKKKYQKISNYTGTCKFCAKFSKVQIWVCHLNSWTVHNTFFFHSNRPKFQFS